MEVCYPQEHDIGTSNKRMQNNLEGYIALITGSARGIGATLARRLAQERVLLTLPDEDEERIRAITGEIARVTGKEPFAVVARPEQSSELNHDVTQVFDGFKRIDILVNSVSTSTHIPFLELSEDA